MTLDPLYVRWPLGLRRCVPKRDLAHHTGGSCFRRVYEVDGRYSYEPDGGGIPVARDDLRDALRLVPLVPVQLDWSI